MNTFVWQNVMGVSSRVYTCGYCGNSVASENGWYAIERGSSAKRLGSICICHQCGKPTFFEKDGTQTPGVLFGNKVNDIPDISIQELYEEARKSTGVGSYTAAVLCCRKLLMHIAVSKGAPVGQTFIKYVEYLADNHYVPPDAKDWVDHIRTKSNEANHEILIMSKNDAEELLSFIEMLLRVIFEFPATVKRKVKPATP